MFCNIFDHSSNVKGNLFENFCYIYLKRFREFDKVWMYKDIPLDIRNKLNLTTMDYGIDLVCLDKHNNYSNREVINFLNGNISKSEQTTIKKIYNFNKLC